MDPATQHKPALAQDAPTRRQLLLQRLPADTLQCYKEELGVSQPKDDQLEVVARMGECQDTILIAGCGWGKSLVFHLPLVLWRDKVVVIITPLTALGDEQSHRLNTKKIRSVNLKESEELTTHQLINGGYRAVFMSPEILFKSSRYMDLWDHDSWKRKLLAIVVDEAHCVSTWENFRTSYLRIRELRYKVHGTTCFIALSATLPPPILATVRKELCFKTVKEINVGNDHVNIKYVVKTMLSIAERRARRVREMEERVKMASDEESEFGPEVIDRFQCLEFLQDKVKTIVYFNRQSDADDATKYFQELMGEDRVGCYHAGKSEECKESCMKDFVNNKICVLMATEAAGMGCDLSDVLRVIQFGYPDSASTLMQRLGRGVRNPCLQGVGILLIPATTAVELSPELKEFTETRGCRRKVLNNYFGNIHHIIPDCCDNCSPEPTTAETRKRSRGHVGPSLSEEGQIQLGTALDEWRKKSWRNTMK